MKLIMLPPKLITSVKTQKKLSDSEVATRVESPKTPKLRLLPPQPKPLAAFNAATNPIVAIETPPSQAAPQLPMLTITMKTKMPVLKPRIAPIITAAPKLQPTAKQPLRLAAFCAGSGAFSVAFEQTARVKTVFAHDISNDAVKLFNAQNFGLTLTQGDICELDFGSLPQFDILTAGWPYDAVGDDNDGPRVFNKLIAILEHSQPAVVVLENVKQMTFGDGKQVDTVLDRLTGAGYAVRWQVLDTAKHTDIPQHRERVFFVGFRDAAAAKRFRFPAQVAGHKTVRELLDKAETVAARYFYDDRFNCWKTVAEGVVDPDVVYTLHRGGIRANKSGVCPTLMKGMGKGSHNVPLVREPQGVRKLTPRETLRLQGFPETYVLPADASDACLYRMAGNAVTVSLVKRLADEILKALAKEPAQTEPTAKLAMPRLKKKIV